MNNAAVISLDQVICSWLSKKGYPAAHYYVEAALYAQEAVQWLQFTSMPLVHHKLITKSGAETFYRLPQGCVKVAKVGIRAGDRWWQLATEESLMPFPNTQGHGDMSSTEFSDDMNISGDYQSWYADKASVSGFNPNNFLSGNFSTGNGSAASSGNTDAAQGVWEYWAYYGWGQSFAPFLGVRIDELEGRILVPEVFPYAELYVAYMGLSDIDNMTNIPLVAQLAIEAYMSWKYEGTGGSEDEFYNQLRVLRAHNDPVNTKDIENLFDKAFYGRSAHSYAFNTPATHH